jgi:hypothetical protein
LVAGDFADIEHELASALQSSREAHEAEALRASLARVIALVTSAAAAQPDE